MAIPMDRVEDRILSIRGQAIKRNAERFPEDFAFRLTTEEKKELVTNCDRFARLKHSTVFHSRLFDAIRALMEPSKIPRRRIGY